jgi:hypothetical protein
MKQIFLFPDDTLKTLILYPVAVIAGSKNRKSAEKLMESFQTATEKDEFRKLGLVVK